MGDKTKQEQEHEAAINEATKAAQLAHANIQRFLDLQAERESALIMKAHEEKINEAAKGAGVAAQLAAHNIQRFLDLQGGRQASLIMRAHQVAAADPEKINKG